MSRYDIANHLYILKGSCREISCNVGNDVHIDHCDCINI
jgi:hypothetical protein